jgi:hypothetical protein
MVVACGHERARARMRLPQGGRRMGTTSAAPDGASAIQQRSPHQLAAAKVIRSSHRAVQHPGWPGSVHGVRRRRSASRPGGMLDL